MAYDGLKMNAYNDRIITLYCSIYVQTLGCP